MSIARGLFDLRYAGVYLPSLVLSTIRPNLPHLTLVIFFSLLCAVYAHGLMRGIFGPDGPTENPLNSGEVIQRLLVSLTGKGPQENFEDNLQGVSEQLREHPELLGLSGLVVTIIGLISWLIWAIGAVTSLYFGVTSFDGLGFTVQLLLFAEVVWVLQWLVWPNFTPAHLLDSEDFG